MPVKDFNKLEDGRPTAAHTWEEQFKGIRETGHIGPAPIAALEARIAQLEAALTNPEWKDHKAAKGWWRESEWRRKQLEQVKNTEVADVSDIEHQE